MEGTLTDYLIFEVQDGVATLTMNRPEKLNAFTSEMLHGLVAALDECEGREDVRTVILTGAGRGFSSGGDIGGMGEENDSRPHITKTRIGKKFRPLQNVPPGSKNPCLPQSTAQQ